MRITVPIKVLSPVLAFVLPLVAAAQSTAKEYTDLGVAKRVKGDHAGAMADFERAIEINPKYARAYYNRGFGAGNSESMMADYNRAIELDSNYAVAYYARGCHKAFKGDFVGAIADHDRSLELDPKFMHGYVARGRAKESMGDSAGAIADYNRAIELDSKFANAYFRRGSVRHSRGDREGAMADFNRVTELEPKYAFAYYNRGVIRLQEGDIESAIVQFNRAIELQPKFAAAYRERARAGYLARNWTDALAGYRRYGERFEDDQDYLRLYIWLIQVRMGKADAANYELSDYLTRRKKTGSKDWISTVGEYLVGRQFEADLFAATASPDPVQEGKQLCEAWFYSGMKKLFAGDKTSAEDCFRKCVEKGKKEYSEYHFAAAELKAMGL